MGNLENPSIFVDFRNESEYEDGKFPVAQIYSQRELRIWRGEQSVLDSKRSREDFIQEAYFEEMKKAS